MGIDYIHYLLENEGEQFRYEPNNSFTRKYFSDLIQFKLNFKEFKDCLIVCDETNNPPSVIDNNQLICDVYHNERLYHLLIDNNGNYVSKYKKVWELD